MESNRDGGGNHVAVFGDRDDHASGRDAQSPFNQPQWSHSGLMGNDHFDVGQLHAGIRKAAFHETGQSFHGQPVNRRAVHRKEKLPVPCGRVGPRRLGLCSGGDFTIARAFAERLEPAGQQPTILVGR